MKITFFSIGDWGYPGYQQNIVSNQMLNQYKIYKPSFVIALGDNFYERGVSGVDDEKWINVFEDIYKLPCKWYAILGNHDYLQNPCAQIDYYKKGLSQRWIMEDKYYTKFFPLKNSKMLQIIFLDTVTLAPITSSNFIPYDFETDIIAQGEIQKIWLESTLKHSSATWKIVVGHYPILSGGEHGNTPELVNYLKPLLEKYKVSTYISGHDHSLQVIKNNNVVYLVNGVGSKIGQVQNTNETEFSRAISGFMIHEVIDNQLTHNIIDHEGNILHKIVINSQVR